MDRLPWLDRGTGLQGVHPQKIKRGPDRPAKNRRHQFELPSIVMHESTKRGAFSGFDGIEGRGHAFHILRCIDLQRLLVRSADQEPVHRIEAMQVCVVGQAAVTGGEDLFKHPGHHEERGPGIEGVVADDGASCPPTDDRLRLMDRHRGSGASQKHAGGETPGSGTDDGDIRPFGGCRVQ